MASRFTQFSIRRLRKPQKLLIGASLLTGVGTTAFFTVPEEKRNIANIGIIRFGRAYSAVTRIVLDYKWSLHRIPSPSEEYNAAIKACHKRCAQRLLELAEVNGGVFIKVGQHIAAMEYLIPPEYTKTLSVLMSNAPQQSMEDIKYVIESEIGKPMNEIFSEFSEKPIGTASLAQVHTACLPTGEKLAVKVQHRQVYQNSITDMDTMEFLAKIADKCFPEFRFMWLVEEVKKNLPNELDFLHEGKNMAKAKETFKHLDFLKIPQYFPELTTKRVLTMEFCDGSQVNDVDYLDKNKINRHDVAKKLGKMISEMIFIKGFLHADPHPGNVLVNRKPFGKVEIVLLDHGLYLNVNDHFRTLYSDLWMAILNADQAAMKVMQRMPREMVLILKTNDLLRNMEHILGCHGRQDSMLEVSKCVIRCHHELAIRRSENFFDSLRLRVGLLWSLLRLRFYEIFLIIKDDLGYV